ncbi:Uncharacterised protein [Escherichia coli]|uniref:Uncharacterized protein n=1 Tax=Escherichia coli TaxID=562 RepID=A0A376MRL1_ECOLX|nr:Uncharacterised protein [Escherichia coli]
MRFLTGHNQRRDGDFTGVAQQRIFINDSGIVAVHAPVELTERSWKPRGNAIVVKELFQYRMRICRQRFWQNTIARTDLAVAVDINIMTTMSERFRSAHPSSAVHSDIAEQHDGRR